MLPRVALCLALVATQTPRGWMRPQPVRDLLYTPGTSPQYLLPTWESSLAVFGVQAESDVHIRLTNEAQNVHVIISLNVTEYGGESQLTVNTSGAAVTVVSRDRVILSADHYIWFSVFRKESVFALTKDGSERPLILYSNDSADLDFYSCNVFQVWSRSHATWDFRGEKYLGVTPGNVPRHPAVRAEVRGAVRGLAERIMAIDFFLDQAKMIFLPAQVRQQLSEVLDDLNPFFLMFRFHGYDFVGSLKIIPTDNIMHARNVLTRFHR